MRNLQQNRNEEVTQTPTVEVKPQTYKINQTMPDFLS